MDRNLALLFFNEAPAQVKEAAEAHKKNYSRLVKAQGQLDLWTLEQAEAKKAFDESQRYLNKSIDAWAPEVPKEKEETTVKAVVDATIKPAPVVKGKV